MGIHWSNHTAGAASSGEEQHLEQLTFLFFVAAARKTHVHCQTVVVTDTTNHNPPTSPLLHLCSSASSFSAVGDHRPAYPDSVSPKFCATALVSSGHISCDSHLHFVWPHSVGNT